MKFEWDKEKDRRNIRCHGFGFERAKTIFDYPYVTRVDNRFHYDETRLLALGLMAGATIIVVAYTHRDETVRIISARKATKREKANYNEFIRKIGR